MLSTQSCLVSIWFNGYPWNKNRKLQIFRVHDSMNSYSSLKLMMLCILIFRSLYIEIQIVTPGDTQLPRQHTWKEEQLILQDLSFVSQSFAGFHKQPKLFTLLVCRWWLIFWLFTTFSTYISDFKIYSVFLLIAHILKWSIKDNVIYIHNPFLRARWFV